MPVPVSVTGWSHGAGNQEVQLEVAEPKPAGLFANLGKGSPAAAAAPAPAPSAPAPAPASYQAELAAREPVSKPEAQEPNIVIKGLDFAYPGIDGAPIPGVEPLIKDMHLELYPGDCCLLLGPNGAGKTTLLKILGGKHMVSKEAVTVLGRPVFHDVALTSSGQLSYIGGDWQRDVAFAGYNVPLAGDFPAGKMLDGVQGVDPERKKRIIEVLDVDVNWRMHQVSDGQRRRVQLAYGLMKPFTVMLLDEITVDLDVLGRADLMQFLKEECKERGCTIIYVTHIFDGMEDWATKIAYVANGKLQFAKESSCFPELQEDGGLLRLMEGLLREEKREREEREEKLGRPMQRRVEVARNNGWSAGRTGSSNHGGASIVDSVNNTISMSGSSNAVMRM